MKSMVIQSTSLVVFVVRCVCYSPMDDLIAIGLGPRVGARRAALAEDDGASKCGAYVILRELTLAVLHEARDSLVPLSCITISNDGETLAIGADDGIIYLYALLVNA